MIKYSKVQLDGFKWTVVLFTHKSLKATQDPWEKAIELLQSKKDVA